MNSWVAKAIPKTWATSCVCNMILKVTIVHGPSTSTTTMITKVLPQRTTKSLSIETMMVTQKMKTISTMFISWFQMIQLAQCAWNSRWTPRMVPSTSQMTRSISASTICMKSTQCVSTTPKTLTVVKLWHRSILINVRDAVNVKKSVQEGSSGNPNKIAVTWKTVLLSCGAVFHMNSGIEELEADLSALFYRMDVCTFSWPVVW